MAVGSITAIIVILCTERVDCGPGRGVFTTLRKHTQRLFWERGLRIYYKRHDICLPKCVCRNHVDNVSFRPVLQSASLRGKVQNSVLERNKSQMMWVTSKKR